MFIIDKEVRILVFLILLGVIFSAGGCSTKKTNKPGLLQQNGIKDAGDLVYITIKMAEGDASYCIKDKSTLERIYELLNDAEPGPLSKYIRPNTVTLVRKNGSTLSFAFSLYNPSLTWQYSSRPFVEFVKSTLVGTKKYADTSHLPSFSIKSAVRVEGLSSNKPLSVVNVGQGIQSIASIYKPCTHFPALSSWQTMISFCNTRYPGVEVTLDNPISFRTLIGRLEPEPPHGSDALKVTTLVVDKMLIYLDRDKFLHFAFHTTTKGNKWFAVGAYNSKHSSGTALESVYREMLSK